MTQIIEKIYIGGSESLNIKFLKENGITHILNCAEEIDVIKEIEQDFTYQKIPILHKIFPRGYHSFESHLEFITQAIGSEESKNKILVNCANGQSRSVGVVVAYFIKNRCIEMDGAVKEIAAKRFVMLGMDVKIQLQNYAASQSVKNI